MMNIKNLVSVALFTWLTATSCSVNEPVKPNVIFIYADDLGKGMLSSYGQKQFTTPNIDRIVDQGIQFTNAYGSAYCAPARASLLTGYHDCRVGKFKLNKGKVYAVLDTALIRAKEDSINSTDILPEPGDLHLAQVFKEAGYVTGEIGKLEWGFGATRKQMAARGWDYYYGFLDHNRCHGFYPPFLFDTGKIDLIEGNTRVDCGLTPATNTEEDFKKRWNMEGKKTYSQDIFIEKILGFIRENKDKPFFLYHPTQLPHGPISVPAVHPAVKNNDHLTQFEKEYASMVLMIDDNVGLIFKELEKLGLEEKTIVIFSADNGHALYYKTEGRCSPYENVHDGTPFDDYKNKYNSEAGGDIFDGNAGSSGLKRSNLDGGINVPLGIYWKNKLKPRVCTELVANYDLLPTMADMLNVKLTTQKSGVSYWGVLTRDEKLPEDRYVICDSQRGGPMIVTNECWKLRYYFPAHVYELFDLNNDPLEHNNLIGEYPEKAAKMEQILKEECDEPFWEKKVSKGKKK